MSDTQQIDGVIIVDSPEGTGKAIVNGSVIRAHYTGTLLDGRKFDSSKDHGEKFEVKIGVGRVIAGWDEGLIGMKEGGIRKLTISPEKAYGDMDIPGIPAGSTLMFTIEDLEILN